MNFSEPADHYPVSQIPGELKQPDRKGLLTRIPAFPPIVLRLLDLLGRDNVEIRELVALISSDPAFSAQILQVANSPLFGFRGQIDSLQSALVVLGLRRVRSLCMTVATANHMKAVLRIEELGRCWRHMLACAILTEELAHSCSAFEDRAYTAGLLHDVGRLGLLLAYPLEYTELLRNAGRNALELLDCERETLGMDHCTAGRLLAVQWNLPPDFQIVAARHHDPQSNSGVDLLTLVHLGCQLADSLGFWVVEPLQPRTAAEIQASLPAAFAKRIQIDGDRWRETVERRIRCYGDPDSAQPIEPMLLPADPEPELPVADLARLHLPDPNESASVTSELLKLVAIGLIFTLMIVAIVYFIGRK
ncbi:MAG TPA: HDOD domain-containing protein [Bryobacteraceae bacterium]|nr:HDOD domain-containing protein [Bryobacteraceae bacterium]